MKYRDAREFVEKHPSKEEREQVLRELSEEEIYHIASTYGNVTCAAGFMSFANAARRRGGQKEHPEMEITIRIERIEEGGDVQ